MPRDEHLSWCKKRAREYLDRGDIKNAVTSMLSDLRKHPETEASATNTMLVGMALNIAMGHNIIEARHFIDGLN